jgi:large repetitive protein
MNCNGTPNDGMNIDADTDGYNSLTSCTNNTDCNDANTAIHPGAAEICDGIDSNCNGTLDGSENLTRACGTSNIGACTMGTESCTDIGGRAGCTATFPALDDACDGIDNNCDGQTDEDMSLKFIFKQWLPTN